MLEFSLLEHSPVWISSDSLKKKKNNKQKQQQKKKKKAAAARNGSHHDQEQLFSGSRKKGKAILRQLSSRDTIQRLDPKMRLFWKLILWPFTLQSNFFLSIIPLPGGGVGGWGAICHLNYLLLNTGLSVSSSYVPMNFLTATNTDYTALHAGKMLIRTLQMKSTMLSTCSSFLLVFQRKTTKKIKLHLTLTLDIKPVLSERHLPKPLT